MDPLEVEGIPVTLGLEARNPKPQMSEAPSYFQDIQGNSMLGEKVFMLVLDPRKFFNRSVPLSIVQI